MDEFLKNKTAILLFARSGKEDEKHKSFWNGRALFDELNASTIRKISRTGLDYIHYSEKEQKGSGFGERFTNAIQEVFDLGYDWIITVGNDTPKLGSIGIIRALSLMEEHDMVIGPSADGGFYLMGLKKELFNCQAFLKLPWQTSALLRALKELIPSESYSWAHLKTMHDLDTPMDIGLMLRGVIFIPISIINYISSYFRQSQPLVIRTEQFISKAQYSVYFNKGSPQIV